MMIGKDRDDEAVSLETIAWRALDECDNLQQVLEVSFHDGP